MHILFENLRGDHHNVRNLLKRILGQDLVAVEKRAIVNHVREEFLVHAKAEEMVVYNRLAELNEPDLTAHLTGSESDHRTIESLLEEMSTTKGYNQNWNDLLKKLIHTIESHAKLDESFTFHKLQQFFSREQLDSMAYEFEMTKQELMSGLLRLPSPVGKFLPFVDIGVV